MTAFIALLRGINVGGHRKVPMADLRALCDAAGFGDTRSYIQSGNLVFAAKGTSEGAEAMLEAKILERFGFPVEVLVRTSAAWWAYAASNPFPDESAVDGGRVQLLLSKLSPRPGADARLEERGAAGERVRSVGDALWVHYPQVAGSSKLTPSFVDRVVGSSVTARNWNTVLQLGNMAESHAAAIG